MTTIYRNYRIAKVGDLYVARSSDDGCVLFCSDQQRLNLAIDDLWASLEKGIEPAWFSGSSAIDLDTLSPEATASETDPPPVREWRISYWLFGASALMVAAPISCLVHRMSLPVETDILFTLGVCAVSVAFGQTYALLMTALSALAYNFFAIEPCWAFNWPCAEEVGYVLVNMLAATVIPALIKIGWYRGSKG